MKFADQITLIITPQHQIIGGATSVAAIAHMAGSSMVASRFGTTGFQEGDQIEWEATLQGRITIDKQMLEDATDKLLR